MAIRGINLCAKAYGLAPGRKPEVHASLSGVVLVTDSEGKGYAYIRFKEALVEALGRRMPQGAGPEMPCYLRVIELFDGRWRVVCSYLDNSKSVIMETSEQRPVWLGKVRRNV